MSFQLKAIELIDYSLIRPSSAAISVTNFNFNINIESRLDTTQKLIVIVTKVNIFADDHVTELGSLGCTCVFGLLDFDKAVKVHEDKTFDLPEGLTEVLNSIAVSTTRGVMFSQFRGTSLHNAFLPLLDIKSLKKEEIKK